MRATTPLLCSIGAFTRSSDPANHRAVLTYGPLLDVDGFEAIFYAQWYPHLDQIARNLSQSGLRFPALHVEKSIGPLLGAERVDDRRRALDILAANCELATRIGSGLLVLHLWGLLDSDEHIERNLAALSACLDTAEQHGLDLAVETIPCTQSDPLSVIQRALARDARCLVALDTEFLARHDQVEEAVTADWLWRGGCVRHVHVKDYDGAMLTPDHRRRYLHPGEGQIDFAEFFSALARRRFDGCVSLEASAIATDGAVDIVRLQRTTATLRRLIRDAYEHAP